jgi:hypothetical protein
MANLLNALIEMRGGQVMADLDAKFNEVLSGVLATGGKGKLTVDLTVEPSKMAVGGMVLEVAIQHNAKMKIPELKIGRSAFFVTSAGDLSRDDPAQEAMFSPEKHKETQNK